MTEDKVATKDVIALHNEGLSPGEIAKRLGTTYDIVYMRLIRAGLTPHPAPLTIPTEDIVALHKEGLSAVEIAARLNVTTDLIRYRLRRAGFEPIVAPKYLKAAERTADIIRLHQEGLTPKHIAERLGIDWTLVHRRLREARLAPNPSREESRNTLRELNEIIKLAKEGIPRHEIAKRVRSTWPLVAEALEGASILPVWPACGELTTWAETLLPILDEIKEAHPNSGPILRKVEKLEKEMLDISDATWKVEQALPIRGKEADKERYCVAEVSQPIKSNLDDRIEPLRGCVKDLDVETLPRKIEQAETCVTSLTDAISRDIRHMPAVQKAMMEHSVTEPPIRAEKINLEPDHIKKYEVDKEASTSEELSEMSADHELLLHFGAEEFCSPGLVLSETRARATPCTCFAYKDRHYCWSKGVIGLLKPEQQEVYCATGKEYKAQPRLVERFTSFAEAAEAAHKKIETMPKGRERLETWLTTMGEELSKRGITI